MKDVQTRPVIQRWEPHEAHHFTKPHSGRSGKPELVENVEAAEPVKARRKKSRSKRRKADGHKNGN